jgi:phosphatidylinositol kinase/protein kinase (PI-3  family)
MMNRYGELEKKEHPWKIDLLEEEHEHEEGEVKKKKKEKNKFTRIKEGAKHDLLRLKQD